MLSVIQQRTIPQAIRGLSGMDRPDYIDVFNRGQAQFECDLEIQADKSIKFVCRARLKEDEDDDWQHEDTFFVAPKTLETDASYTHVVDLVRSEDAWPVRAHMVLTIDNNRL